MYDFIAATFADVVGSRVYNQSSQHVNSRIFFIVNVILCCLPSLLLVLNNQHILKFYIITYVA